LADKIDGTFPDQLHLDHVKEALWRRQKKASVMVGSGFSRNAVSVRPDGVAPPLWSDLVDALAEALHAGGTRKDQGAQNFSAGDALRLAQDFEIAFGRQSLHKLIAETIRDSEYEPGELHRTLLGLPWRDVFTTNWDTLLERANRRAGEPYSVVTGADQFAMQAQPRIIKLHGSLPASFPLVFTEEDYRLYPTRFAPFVNAVQQSMIETVLVLVGFSGEDPNFLRWLGWVRDNLGSSAPKIYLTGWLNLQDYRRRTLEANNVVPIDMARWPGAEDWPRPKRRERAVARLLEDLQQGQRYPAEEWPRVLAGHASSEAPLEEPAGRTSEQGDDGPRLEAVRAVLAAWAHNRSVYPGWLSVPFGSGHQMRDRTDAWEPRILAGLSDLDDGIARIDAVGALVWRRRVLLDRLSSDLVAAAEEATHEVDSQRRVGGSSERTEDDWDRAGLEWCRVAAGLVTDARFDGDRARSDEWIAKLADAGREHPWVEQFVHHEECLWLHQRQDYNELVKELDRWRTEDEGNDPAWSLRKAAMLAGVNRVVEARRLVVAALERIRGWRERRDNLAAQSRESWAVWLDVSLEHDYTRTFRRLESELWPLWRQFARLRCDPGAETTAYEQAMRRSESIGQKVPFDLGRRQSDSLGISSAQAIRRQWSYRALRLTEVVGLPTKTRHVAPAEPLLKGAAENLRDVDPYASACLTVRATDYDGDKDYTASLKRSHVATMPMESLEALVDSQLGVVEYALPRVRESDSRRNVFWCERLRVAIETVSRLAIRLPEARVEKIFEASQELYIDPRIREDLWFAEPLYHLMLRCWEALPPKRRSDLVLGFLSLPIAKLDGFDIEYPHHYRDPRAVVAQSHYPTPARSAEDDPRWEKVVALLERGLTAGGEARMRAASRASEVVFWSALNASERERLGHAIWGSEWRKTEGLPVETRLSDWVILYFEEPEPGIAETRLRAKWFGTQEWARERTEDLEGRLEAVGLGLHQLQEHCREFEVSDEEQGSLERMVEAWAKRPPSGPAWPFGRNRVKERRTVRAVAFLLLGATMRAETVGLLTNRVLDHRDYGAPAFELVPGILASIPGEWGRLTLALRTGLGSEDFDEVLSAARGLFHWLVEAEAPAPALPPPPSELVREVGVVVATRRWVALANFLEIVVRIFKKGAEEHREELRELVLHGLTYLRQELRFGSSEHVPRASSAGFADDDRVDVPLLRLRCVETAIALAGAGLADEPPVAGWLEEAEDDPLPEVRFAIEDWHRDREGDLE